MTDEQKIAAKFAQGAIMGAVRTARQAGLGYQIQLDDLRGNSFTFYTDGKHRPEDAQDVLLDLITLFERKGTLTKPELIQLVVRAKKQVTNF